MKESPLAAYLWGAVHHPDFPNCRWQLRFPIGIHSIWHRSSMTLSLHFWLQEPIVLNMDYRVLDAYAKIVLKDPYWDDIPF